MAVREKINGAEAGKGMMSNSIKLDAENPIPIGYNGQTFMSSKGKRYVPFLNPADNFFQFLTEAYLLSNTTKACVDSKADYFAGTGFTFNDNDAPDDFIAWAKNVNRKNKSLKEVVHGAFHNLNVVGNAFIQVVRSSVGGKKVVRVYLRNYMDCRLSEPDEDDVCVSVVISKEFRRAGVWKYNPDKATEIPLYTGSSIEPNWVKDEKGNEHTMFHLCNETSGYDHYGMPSNIASLPQQLLEYKAARYNLDNFENNLVVGGMVVIKDAMTDEEAKKMAKDITYTHAGDGKRGRYMIVSREAGITEGVDIQEFNTEKDASFIEGDSHNEEKIYVANKWNKLLIGGSEKKSIGAGNNAFIQSVYTIANNTVIKPEQGMMIEKFLQPLLKICDEWLGTKWSANQIEIKPLDPISFLSDVDINAVMTVNEGRKLAGLEPIDGEKGEAFIKSGGTSQQNDPNVQNQPTK